jgi:hypothetical protein
VFDSPQGGCSFCSAVTIGADGTEALRPRVSNEGTLMLANRRRAFQRHAMKNKQNNT